MAVFFKRKPTKAEQIEVLKELSAIKMRDLLRECIDFDKTPHKTIEDLDNYYQAFFTVTKSEILSYIKSNYSLRDLGLFEEQDNFRLNVREEKNRFKTFTRCWDTEVRGLPYKEYNIKYFSTEDEVYEEYVDHITGCSGTGLTFEDKE